MKSAREPLWTIDELGAKAAESLAVDYEGPPNDRVREVPDRRTIRYYTTIGLIDRPAEMRGRTAFYGLRHLMQLAAIKRLQAQGRSLAQVQRELVGLPDSALARLARLPPGLGTGAPSSIPGAQGNVESRGRAFWKAEPAPADATPAPLPEGRPAEVECPPARPLAGIGLGEEATLLLAAKRPLNDEDLEAIRKAAAPLLRVLTRRGLIAPRPGRGDR